MSMAELASVANWMECRPARREEVARAIAQRLGPDFVLEGVFRYDTPLPIARYVHLPTRLRLSLLPGGEFTMGWSAEEDTVLRRLLHDEMRGQYERWVQDYQDGQESPTSLELERAGDARLESKVDALLSMLDASTDPLTEEEADIAGRSVLGVFSPGRANIEEPPASFDDYLATVGAERLSEIDEALCLVTMRPAHRVRIAPFLMAQTPLGNDYDFEEANHRLAAWGMRLPSEGEWEYGARATTRSITFRGDVLPDERDVDEFDPTPPQERGAAERYEDDGHEADDPYGEGANAFGLHGIGAYPEICADAFHENYIGAPNDGTSWAGPGDRVLRGGAGQFAPWQGTHEWVLMLSAYRYAGECGWPRPVLALPRI